MFRLVTVLQRPCSNLLKAYIQHVNDRCQWHKDNYFTVRVVHYVLQLLQPRVAVYGVGLVLGVVDLAEADLDELGPHRRLVDRVDRSARLDLDNEVALERRHVVALLLSQRHLTLLRGERWAVPDVLDVKAYGRLKQGSSLLVAIARWQSTAPHAAAW